MQPTSIIRPSWLALHGRSLLLGVVAIAGVVASAACFERHRQAPVWTTPLPVITAIPVTVPAPAVHVEVVMPTAQPVEPEAEIEPARSIPVRAIVPYLEAKCVASVEELEGDGTSSCSWTNGLPAISGDGSTIVDLRGRGYQARLRFIDARTSKVTREVRLSRDSELDDQYVVKEPLRPRVIARIAALQAELEAGGFRSLVEIAQQTTDAPRPGLYIERATYEGAARIVDGDANVQLWRGEFPHRVPDTNEVCGPHVANLVEAWWDARSRVVMLAITYDVNAETCSDPERLVVGRAATP